MPLLLGRIDRPPWGGASEYGPLFGRWAAVNFLARRIARRNNVFNMVRVWAPFLRDFSATILKLPMFEL